MKILRIPNNPERILGSHLFVKDKKIQRELASDMFQFLDTAYKYVGGFKSFTGEDDFIQGSYFWYVTYDGPIDDMSDFDINKVYTVAVFKQKHGLKLVGAGCNRFYNISKEDGRKLKKQQANSAFIQMNGWAMKHSWMEVSGKMEDFISKHFSDKYIIDPQILKDNNVFKDMVIEADGVHYTRTLTSGLKVTKIAYGNIDLSK